MGKAVMHKASERCLEGPGIYWCLVPSLAPVYTAPGPAIVYYCRIKNVFRRSQDQFSNTIRPDDRLRPKD